MNVYDAERMADLLAPEGYAETARHGGGRPRHPQHLPYPREGGREGLFRARAGCGEIEARPRRRQGRATKVVVAGCVAQAEGREILRRAPVVDVVVGPQSYHHLPDLLRRAAQERGVVDTEFPVEDKFDHLPAPSRARPEPRRLRLPDRSRKAATSSAPSASCPTRAARRSRGRSPRSSTRPSASPTPGVREITLIGQNVNAYHGEGPDGRDLVARRACSIASPRSPASRACATRRAIRATWTTR